MDPIATETTETPVVESKVTEKVVEDVEDTPVVASGEETETPAPVEDAPAAPATTTKEEVPAVESTGDAPAEVTENGNGEAVAVVEPVVVVEAEESVKRKAGDEEVTEVPEKKAKTDEAEAKKIEAVVEPAEEVTA